MKKTKQRLVILEQWAEIEIQNGEPVTTLYPSTAELRKKAAEMNPLPDLVYRRLNFQGPIPSNYFWTTHDPLRRARGGHCIQRMTYKVWLEIIPQEESSPGQHLGPCGGIVPRPKERGGCDCPQCTAAAERLEARRG
jgi:hypothetical protein